MYFSPDSSLDPKYDNGFDRKVVSDSRKNVNNEVLVKKKVKKSKIFDGTFEFRR